MSDLVTESHSVNLLSVADKNFNPNPSDLLDETFDDISKYENSFSRRNSRCKLIYYITGLAALMINVIITAFSANYTPDNSAIIFVLSIIASIITSALNFLEIETKISRYEQTRKSYHDLRLELHNFQSHNNSDADILAFITDVSNKQRKIDFDSVTTSVTFC